MAAPVLLIKILRQSSGNPPRECHIADGSDDAIFAKDLEGRYILFNRAASKFVGKPVEEVLGRDDQAIFPAEQAEILMAIGRRAITQDRVLTQEEVLDTADGKRVFLATKGPLRDDDGKVIGLFGISRDSTERKQAEEALRRQAEELVQRNAELERFNRATVGRELDMIERKKQVNKLSRQLGREPPFSLAFLDTPALPAEKDAP